MVCPCFRSNIATPIHAKESAAGERPFKITGLKIEDCFLSLPVVAVTCKPHRFKGTVGCTIAFQSAELYIKMKGKKTVVRHGDYLASTIERPSCTSSMLSIAISFASAFRSAYCTLQGHALWTAQVITGWCSSSSSLMVISRLNFSFPSWNIMVLRQRVYISNHPKHTAFECDITVLGQTGLFGFVVHRPVPSRYSITSVSTVSPDISVNPIRVPPPIHLEMKFGQGIIF